MEEILYHYTSIDRFAQILKNRTIRLSPLDRMDDLQENITNDIRNIGRFFFASCWTDDVKESIPMWNMYTDPRAGIRIGLPKNPFRRHGTSAEALKTIYGSIDSGSTAFIDTFLDLSSLIKKGVFSSQAWNGDILKQITYTEDITKLEPKIATIKGDLLHLDTSTVGVYKNTHWDFQNEWRYLMMFLPLDLKIPLPDCLTHFNEVVNALYRGELKPPFNYYDLEIASEMYDRMIITPSPKMTEGNRILLQALIDKYNPAIKVVDSELIGKI